MTLHELERKLVELDELRTELKSAIDEVKSGLGEKPKPPHPRWKPEYKGKYYIVLYNGCSVETYWAGCTNDNGEYAIGNIFKTKDEAEFEAEHLKVLAEMSEWAGEYGDPVSIAYYENDGKVESIAALYPNRGEAVFATYEDAEGCIRAIGQERLKKYYFRVSEDEDDDDRRT